MPDGSFDRASWLKVFERWQAGWGVEPSGTPVKGASVGAGGAPRVATVELAGVPESSTNLCPLKPSKTPESPDIDLGDGLCPAASKKGWDAQFGMLSLGGGGAASAEGYLEAIAKPLLKLEHPLEKKCGLWSLFGRCANGHRWAKKLYCGREWCGVCREKVQGRRFARWLPKAQQIGLMGYFVITFPPGKRTKLRSKGALSRAGKAIVKVLKEEGFDRGLRRWHWFGDGEEHRWHPHLNIIVDGGYRSRKELRVLRRKIAKSVGVKDLVMNYQYTKEVGKKVHILKYVNRATFLDWHWDEEMAMELRGFRNNLWWGHWDDEPVWSLNEGGQDLGAVAELEQSICPKCGKPSICSKCGKPIVWDSKPIPSVFIEIEGGRDVGEGYYELPDDDERGRSPPELVLPE